MIEVPSTAKRPKSGDKPASRPSHKRHRMDVDIGQGQAGVSTRRSAGDLLILDPRLLLCHRRGAAAVNSAEFAALEAARRHIRALLGIAQRLEGCSAKFVLKPALAPSPCRGRVPGSMGGGLWLTHAIAPGEGRALVPAYRLALQPSAYQARARGSEVRQSCVRIGRAEDGSWAGCLRAACAGFRSFGRAPLRDPCHRSP